MSGYWLTPKGARVVVEIAERRQLSSLIEAPQNFSERSPQQEGTVVAVGPDVTGITVGDHVLFSPYSGTAAPGPFRNKKVVVMSASDVVASVDNAGLEAAVEAERAADESRESESRKNLAKARAALLAGDAAVNGP